MYFMQYETSDDLLKKAKHPHELFLINLVFNHILMFIAALGVVGTMPYFLMCVPILSICILSYTLWRAKRSASIDSWYVMCHWQICARRSKLFLMVVLLLLTAFLLGWIGFTYWGMEKVPVMAMIGGLGILPTMGSVLLLIVLESDILHQAKSGKLPDWVVEKFPKP
jgi:hypothetical protein